MENWSFANFFERVLFDLFVISLAVALTIWGIKGFPIHLFKPSVKPVAETSIPEPSIPTPPTEPVVEVPLVLEDSPPPGVTRSQAMQSLIERLAREQGADFSIFLKDQGTGDTAVLNAAKSVPSGSIYKLFVALEAYRRNELGTFRFDQPAGGTGLTVHECVVRMVRNSTNICGEAVRDMLGRESLNQELHSQGYTGVDFVSREAAHVSSSDIALLYERLLSNKALNDGHRAEFLQSLKDQEWTFRIPEGLPREPAKNALLDWGNKTGDVYDYANDSSIVWGENSTYILVIMSRGWNSIFPESSYGIRHMSGEVYNFMNETSYQLVY